MWRTVDSSVYCLPADLLGEGAGRVATQLRDRAGGPGLTVAASYHASRDILPHNPVYRVASMSPGAFYHVDPSAYPGSLRPAVSPSADGRDILAEACRSRPGSACRCPPGPCSCTATTWTAARRRCSRTASATASAGRLCPANPAMRNYVLAMFRELCRYPIAALRAKALHYQGATHGHHHERCLEDYGELARWLLGLCFCSWCAARHQKRRRRPRPSRPLPHLPDRRLRRPIPRPHPTPTPRPTRAP